MTSALVLPELGGAIAGAVAGPPAEHALSRAAVVRLRIGTVRRAAFIDVLRRGLTVGRLADRGRGDE
jgi:outer membrane lipoprotein SlyB